MKRSRIESPGKPSLAIISIGKMVVENPWGEVLEFFQLWKNLHLVIQFVTFFVMVKT